MAPLTSWNIYTPDGTYLGRYPAFASQTALCVHLLLKGKTVAERDIHVETIDEGSEKLTYLADVFIVRDGSK